MRIIYIKGDKAHILPLLFKEFDFLMRLTSLE